MTPAPALPDLYTGPGFQFRYPSGWFIDEDRDPDELTVTVRPDVDDGTAFWSVTIMLQRPPVQSAMRTIVRAFEDEYSEIDTYPAEQEIAGRRAVGRDLEFVCLELTNTAGVRVFRTKEFTAVVLFQATDSELEQVQSAFRLMTGSLECRWDGGDE